MIDLTDVTDEVVRHLWDDVYGHRGASSFDGRGSVAKAALKSQFLPIIAATAEAVEAEVRREIRIKLDSIPRADLGGLTISVEAALEAAR